MPYTGYSYILLGFMEGRQEGRHSIASQVDFKIFKFSEVFYMGESKTKMCYVHCTVFVSWHGPYAVHILSIHTCGGALTNSHLAIAYS